MNKEEPTDNKHHEELPDYHDDPLIEFLHRTIRSAVKVLAVLMVFVIIWGIGDVIYVLYIKLKTPPIFLLNISDILATFGAFLAVLIAIEIFTNITLYIRNDILPVNLVVATALMAISRKVIIFDFKELTPMYILATATVVLALGVTYWLISKK
jgi:uncharacterized membrane protein (DUF373 family)